MARFKIADAGNQTDTALLEAIGRQRGALQSGGRVNLTKAAEIVINDFRSGQLGRLTLETPAQFAEWLAAGQVRDAERQVKKDAIEHARLVRLKKIPRPSGRVKPRTESDEV